MSCKNLLKQMLLILEIQMVKMTAKNRLKIVKIFNQRNKKKKIMKIYKFSQKKYFLKNLLQEGINRFKSIIIWIVCACLITFLQFYLIVLILKANNDEQDPNTSLLNVY